MSVLESINPPRLGVPRGWTNGILAPAGSRLLFVAGQTAADPAGGPMPSDFAAQFDAALAKALLVVSEAGGKPEGVVRVTVYVTDLDAYRGSREELGRLWKRRMGSHYPAMALVEVSRLLEPGAVVEMEMTAVIDDRQGDSPVS